jgi:hypothetical protein
MKAGMGWLGWTEQQTLDATIPAVMTAIDGRREMLRAIFGGKAQGKGKPAPADGLVSAKDPAAVKALFMGMKARQG